MKKLILMIVSGVVYTSLMTGSATAQKAINASFGTPSASTSNDKTIDATAVNPTDKTAVKEMKANLKAAKANLKVTNDLEKNFKGATNMTSYSEDKVIVAKFNMGEKSARVVYDKRGNWLYSVITYFEAQLPADIKAQVRAEYRDFNITMVQEISQGNISGLYKVFLENDTQLKQVLVYNNEITVYEDFNK